MYRLIKGIRYFVDIVILLIVLLVVAYSGYSIWDGYHTYESASNTQFQTYKPPETINNQHFSNKHFRELQKKNPDVFGWIDIFGTTINYPMVQGKTNDDYLNHDPLKNFSLSGSIFLDSNAPRNLSNFTNIIYGHHMEKHKMFGDLDLYRSKSYALKHRKGNLYYNNRYHGIDLIAFIDTSAYDQQIYGEKTNLEQKQAFISYLKHKAKYLLANISPNDRLVILSTCADGTDKRHIVVAKLRQKAYPVPKTKYNQQHTKTIHRYLIYLLFLIFLLLLLGYFWYKKQKRSTD